MNIIISLAMQDENSINTDIEPNFIFTINRFFELFDYVKGVNKSQMVNIISHKTLGSIKLTRSKDLKNVRKIEAEGSSIFIIKKTSNKIHVVYGSELVNHLSILYKHANYPLRTFSLYKNSEYSDPYVSYSNERDREYLDSKYIKQDVLYILPQYLHKLIPNLVTLMSEKKSYDFSLQNLDEICGTNKIIASLDWGYFCYDAIKYINKITDDTLEHHYDDLAWRSTRISKRERLHNFTSIYDDGDPIQKSTDISKHERFHNFTSIYDNTEDDYNDIFSDFEPLDDIVVKKTPTNLLGIDALLYADILYSGIRKIVGTADKFRDIRSNNYVNLYMTDSENLENDSLCIFITYIVTVYDIAQIDMSGISEYNDVESHSEYIICSFELIN